MTKELYTKWVDKFLATVEKFLGKAKMEEILKSVDEKTVPPESVILMLSRALNDDQSGELQAVLSKEMTSNIGEDELLEIVQAGDGMSITKISDLLAKAEKDEMVYFVAMQMRHGLAVAMSEIEHNLFPPHQEDNDQFEYYLADLPPGDPMALPMVVFGVPKSYETQVKEILLSNGLKPCKDGGAMTVLGGAKELTFGVYGKNVFPLENVSDHMAYKSGRTADEEDKKRSAAEYEYRKSQRIQRENEQTERGEGKEEAGKEGS